ncbi:hypothetical protein BC835DRAFT_1468577 [Cytidiella melzeri]|nr:hypothetical protein BC835DRAFT_1468577 [Cytidiella melzeri]
MSSSSLGDPDSTANDRAPTVPQQISPSSSSRQFSPVVQARDSNCVPKLESEEIWEPNPLEIYGNVPQVMFPTPCELLAELAEQDQSTSKTRRVAAPVASSSSMGPRSPSRASTSRKCSTRAAKPENIRKSYFRAVADYVGFKPTDPDTITSHDKKRQYLETLEQYIIWLHDQIKLVGQTPMPMQRVDTCRELSSDSVRVSLQMMLRELPCD